MCFAEYAAIYAKLGIATLPIIGKRPAISSPQRIELKRSLALAADPKFALASIGTWCGGRSGLTVVDIDQIGDDALELALRDFGATPLVVRTHSGKHHAYYAHNGERRLQRPGGRLLDVLGAGPVVLPPSEGANGQYKFVCGGLGELRDRAKLPTINRHTYLLLSRAKRGENISDDTWAGSGRDIGTRDKILFDLCRVRAAKLDNLSELEAYALAENAQLDPPLSEAQAMRKAKSAWDYKLAGKLLLPGCEPSILLTRSQIESFGSDLLAFNLYAHFRVHHEPRRGEPFAAALRPLAKRFKVGPKRINDALELLIARGDLRRTHKGGRNPGDPSRYVLLPSRRLIHVPK